MEADLNEPVWHDNGPIFDSMQTQIGEYHQRDGLTFRRLDTDVQDGGRVHPAGTVRIRRWYQFGLGSDSGQWSYRDIAYIPANEWYSVMRETAAPEAPAHAD